MKCENVHKDLISYLDGSLNKKESSAVKSHLDSCEECRGFSDKLRVTLDYIVIEKKAPISQDFADKVIVKLDSEVNESGLFYRFRPVLTAAAVVLFAIFVGNSLAQYFTERGGMTEQGYHEEFLYANELYMEPIENFFLMTEDNYEKN